LGQSKGSKKRAKVTKDAVAGEGTTGNDVGREKGKGTSYAEGKSMVGTSVDIDWLKEANDSRIRPSR